MTSLPAKMVLELTATSIFAGSIGADPRVSDSVETAAKYKIGRCIIAFLCEKNSLLVFKKY